MNVAVTPHGNADSPTPNGEGDLVFVKPWEESQPFPEFVDFVSQQELRGRKEGEELRYAQTRTRTFYYFIPWPIATFRFSNTEQKMTISAMNTCYYSPMSKKTYLSLE